MATAWRPARAAISRSCPACWRSTGAWRPPSAASTLVFGHNDLLPANLIDDGSRLWLIDWDYAGFNSPLFDLANLASNNQLAEEQEAWLLEAYYRGSPRQATSGAATRP